jgi:hypothetical protein
LFYPFCLKFCHTLVGVDSSSQQNMSLNMNRVVHKHKLNLARWTITTNRIGHCLTFRPFSSTFKNMKTFFLRGLPEALVGRSSVVAESLESIWAQFPVLNPIRKHIVVQGNLIFAFPPCDG